MPRRIFGRVFSLTLALLLAAPADALAKWRGIDRAESRIIFAGEPAGADSESNRHLRLEDSGGKRETYEIHWRARGWRLPVLPLRLRMQAPGHAFRRDERKTLEHLIRTHPLFRGRAFAALEAGTEETVLGSAEYLVFKAGKNRCGTSRLYLKREVETPADALGDTMMTALWCPPSGEVDAARLASVLARTGVRGIADPEAGPVEDPSAPDRDEVLAALAQSGDMKGLRRISAGDLDPDTVVAFSHPQFANGRTIRRPMLMAASLFGHVEMVVFLLDHGAATSGRAAGAICAAIARDHPRIVEVLLDADPVLAEYERCGHRGGLSAMALAQWLDRRMIVDRRGFEPAMSTCGTRYGARPALRMFACMTFVMLSPARRRCMAFPCRLSPVCSVTAMCA